MTAFAKSWRRQRHSALPERNVETSLVVRLPPKADKYQPVPVCPLCADPVEKGLVNIDES